MTKRHYDVSADKRRKHKTLCRSPFEWVTTDKKRVTCRTCLKLLKQGRPKLSTRIWIRRKQIEEMRAELAAQLERRRQ